MTGSQLPWGLAIFNSQLSYGNETIIDSSYIGQTATGAHPADGSRFFSVSGPQSGDVAYIQGSTDGVGGPDTVVVRNGTVINGGLDLNLGAGDKDVALDSSTMSCFDLTTGRRQRSALDRRNDHHRHGGDHLGFRQQHHLAATGQYQRDARFAAESDQRVVTVTRLPRRRELSVLRYCPTFPTFSLADCLETLQTDAIPNWALFPPCEKPEFRQISGAAAPREPRRLFVLCGRVVRKSSRMS